MGVPTEAKTFQQNISVFWLKSSSRYEYKACIKDVTVILSIPVLHAENSLPTLFFPVACSPRKVIRYMISDFDVYEVDVNMQMNFLNAVPQIPESQRDREK